MSPLAPANHKIPGTERFPPDAHPLSSRDENSTAVAVQRTLLIHGIIDDVVPIENSQKFYDTLTTLSHTCPSVEFLPLPSADHVTPLLDIMLGTGVCERICAFVRSEEPHKNGSNVPQSRL